MPLLPLEMYPLTYRINILHGDSHFCLIKSACFSKVWSVACLLYFWQEVHSTDLRKREASTYLYLDGQGRVPMVPFTMKYIIIIITIIIIVIITIIIIIYMTYIYLYHTIYLILYHHWIHQKKKQDFVNLVKRSTFTFTFTATGPGDPAEQTAPGR